MGSLDELHRANACRSKGRKRLSTASTEIIPSIAFGIQRLGKCEKRFPVAGKPFHTAKRMLQNHRIRKPKAINGFVGSPKRSCKAALYLSFRSSGPAEVAVPNPQV